MDASHLAALPSVLKSKPELDSDAQRVAFLFVLYQQLGSMVERPLA